MYCRSMQHPSAAVLQPHGTLWASASRISKSASGTQTPCCTLRRTVGLGRPTSTCPYSVSNRIYSTLTVAAHVDASVTRTAAQEPQYNRELDLFLPPPQHIQPQPHEAQDTTHAWKLDQQYAALFSSFRASAPEQKAF